MTPSLRSGCAPARLLLELWQAQADGRRWLRVTPSRALATTLQKGFIYKHYENDTYTLTPAGREAAQVLDAGRWEK